ncbi:hypothetical protein J6590_087395 [Homalodisca vitripennis]|nr:hypothetical protein J6590_087395 [Homalodisca vitripennis]
MDNNCKRFAAAAGGLWKCYWYSVRLLCALTLLEDYFSHLRPSDVCLSSFDEQFKQIPMTNIYIIGDLNLHVVPNNNDYENIGRVKTFSSIQ